MPDDLVIWPSAVLSDPSTSFAQDMSAMSLRTQMDSGLVRQRPRFTTSLQTYSVEWGFPDEEYQIFIAWFEELLHHGNDWFLINLPTGGGMVQQKARFVDAKYTSSYKDFAFWNVRASLEVAAPARMAEGMVLLLMDPVFIADLPNFELAIENLYTLTHVTFPAQLT